MENQEDEILEFCEFETKYRTDVDQRYPFKRIMEEQLDLNGEKFLYVQSGDDYYTLDIEDPIGKYFASRDDLSEKDQSFLIHHFTEFVGPDGLDLPLFLRHRASDSKKNKREELTFKKKYKKTNNIQRTEVNLRTDASDKATTKAFIEGMGYKYKFDVYKYCDIYFGGDAVLVFYSVKDKKGGLDHFIEIEVNEDMEFTEEQGWDIIKKYEKILEPVGVTAKKRIKRSLFEMYNK